MNYFERAQFMFDYLNRRGTVATLMPVVCGEMLLLNKSNSWSRMHTERLIKGQQGSLVFYHGCVKRWQNIKINTLVYDSFSRNIEILFLYFAFGGWQWGIRCYYVGLKQINMETNMSVKPQQFLFDQSIDQYLATVAANDQTFLFHWP